MKKWQDYKEEILIFIGLFIVEPILIMFEIIGERISKIYRKKKCGERL